MRIEALTICVNYDDFLAATLPSLMSQVDRLMVVTSNEDKATQDLCRRHGVECLKTHVFTDWGCKFNKSKAIAHAMSFLELDGWFLHVDSDIVVPHTMRQMLDRIELDPTCLYGVDRVDCPNYDEWIKYLAYPVPQYEWSSFVRTPKNWHVGSRFHHGFYNGYMPIGYYQLHHPGASGITKYPVKVKSDAEHSDILHSSQWPRSKRVLIPDFFVIHLGSGPANLGANWNGRTTPRFGPTPTQIHACPNYGNISK